MKAKKEMFETAANDLGIRINKYLADSGLCSRREADRAVEEGKVMIDGVVAEMGSRVKPGQSVTYCGKDVNKVDDLILIAFNKPVGIVCTTDRRDPDNIIDFISYPKRIFPIGRLDKDSEGLILLTNDGDIVNKILRSGNFHEKEYVVKVNKDITPEFISDMSKGVEILDQVSGNNVVTRPCTVSQLDRFTFRIILTQGLNRQIRRMCEALGYRVRALQRIRIMNINLGRLKSGTYRNVTELELNKLRELIADSSNTPVSGRSGKIEGCADTEDIEASGEILREQAYARYQKTKTKQGFSRGASHESKTYTKDQGRTYDNTGKKGTDRRTDRSSFSGSKSIRTGRPRDNK